MPLHLRRELLLSNGVRIMLGDTNPDKDWSNEIFSLDGQPLRVERELLGDEKTPSLRPPRSGSD